MTDADGEGRLKRGERVMIEGMVYCLRHTMIHDESVSPGCKEDHRPIAWTARAGDVR